MYKRVDESVDDFLIYCSVARELWFSFLFLFEMVWAFPSIVIELLLVWRGAKSWQEKEKGLPFGAFAFDVDYLHVAQ